MASTTFSGPVTSTAGFVGAVTGAVTGNVTATTVTATNVDAGASGTAGTIDVFPTTAAKGKTQFTAADNAGNTTTTITTAEQAAARTYTVPDAGAAASFVMTAGAQTIAGTKTFSSAVIGDLTGNVTGNVTGVLTGTQLMTTATVAATGTDNTDAAAVAVGFTLVSAGDGTKGVILPTAAAGKICIIKNGANAVLKIYPGASDGINALTVTTGSLNIAALTSTFLIAYDATTWYSLPLLAS